jgi:hypothetical protein
MENRRQEEIAGSRRGVLEHLVRAKENKTSLKLYRDKHKLKDVWCKEVDWIHLAADKALGSEKDGEFLS